MLNWWKNIAKFGANKLNLRNFFAISGLVLSSQIAFASEANTESAIINTNEVAPEVLESYISSKTYSKVIIDDTYGKLLYESQVVNYKPKDLNKFLPGMQRM